MVHLRSFGARSSRLGAEGEEPRGCDARAHGDEAAPRGAKESFTWLHMACQAWMQQSMGRFDPAFSTSPRRAYGKRPANAAGHVCELHGREPREATEGQCHEITPSSEPGALGMLVPLSIQKMEREMNMTRQVAQVPSTRAAAGSRCTTMLCAGSRPIKMA